MTNELRCLRCSDGIVNEACIDAFKRIGLIKAHWECWSACNLACPFCYRTKDSPVATDDAKRLLQALRLGGASIIAFAGGDPSIRPDIHELVVFANDLGLRVEVQTNAHHISSNFIASLKYVQLIGLSLDAPNAELHDRIRHKAGNFGRVLNFLDTHCRSGASVFLRTVVTKHNYRSIHQMIELVSQYPQISGWSLLECSPVGDAIGNWNDLRIDHSTFQEVTEQVKRDFHGPAKLGIFDNSSKMGAYLLITPAANAYGVTESVTDGHYPVVGNLLTDNLCTIANRLPFSDELHHQRYGKD